MLTTNRKAPHSLARFPGSTGSNRRAAEREVTNEHQLIRLVTAHDSKTDKSALVHIVDYCFASKECQVPEGIIRRAVPWFGLYLQSSNEQAFAARQAP
jgi:hypothetical protein